MWIMCGQFISARNVDRCLTPYRTRMFYSQLPQTQLTSSSLHHIEWWLSWEMGRLPNPAQSQTGALANPALAGRTLARGGIVLHKEQTKGEKWGFEALPQFVGWSVSRSVNRQAGRQAGRQVAGSRWDIFLDHHLQRSSRLVSKSNFQQLIFRQQARINLKNIKIIHFVNYNPLWFGHTNSFSLRLMGTPLKLPHVIHAFTWHAPVPTIM